MAENPVIIEYLRLTNRVVKGRAFSVAWGSGKKTKPTNFQEVAMVQKVLQIAVAHTDCIQV